MNPNNKHLYGNLRDMKKCILIDDDLLVAKMWEFEARRQGIELIAFRSVEEFTSKYSLYEIDTNIYIDSNLGDGILGENEAEKIYKLGFENISLVTGKSKDEIRNTKWLKSIQGKRPSF